MRKLSTNHWLHKKLEPQKNRELVYNGSLKNIKKSSPKVAVIGSRNVSFYTYEFLPYLMRFLNKINATLVSGGAAGVDILSHQLSLDHNIPNISILATAINKVSPKENQDVVNKITKNGVAISLLNERPKKYHFLERNQLIINISDIIVIPQASLQSGTYKTALEALKLNKLVFVLPARAFEHPYLGNLDLLRKGAHLIGDFRDLFKHPLIYTKYNAYLSKHLKDLKNRVQNSEKMSQVQILDKLCESI